MFVRRTSPGYLAGLWTMLAQVRRSRAVGDLAAVNVPTTCSPSPTRRLCQGKGSGLPVGTSNRDKNRLC